MIKESSSFVFFFFSSNDSDSENMIKFLQLISEMFTSTCIARASAVKMELSFGTPFLIIVLSKMAAQAILSLSWSHL